VFHGFGQANFAYGGSILGLSQFTLLPQLPLRMTLNLKVVKIDLKISNLVCQSKSVTHSVVEWHFGCRAFPDMIGQRCFFGFEI